jgi:hypothetical protein
VPPGTPETSTTARSKKDLGFPNQPLWSWWVNGCRAVGLIWQEGCGVGCVRSGSDTAAVDRDGDAVDEARVVAGEVGDLCWIGDAAGGYQGCELG